MSRLHEYEICKERGHVADPFKGASVTLGSIPGPAKQTCKYCQTVFWNTTQVTTHESNAPTNTNLVAEGDKK